MAGGLLSAIAGGIGGGGQAVQQNAMSQIEQKRQSALEQLRHSNTVAREDTRWERESQAAASSAALEEQRRMEERQWQLSDADRDHERSLELQQTRNQGRGLLAPPSRIREAEMLVERGAFDSFDEAYQVVRASAGQNNDYARGEDQASALQSRIERIQDDLSGKSGRMLNKEEQEALAEDLSYYRSLLEQTENRVYRIPPPSRGSGSREPPPASPQPERQGQASEGEDPATAILNKFF